MLTGLERMRPLPLKFETLISLLTSLLRAELVDMNSLCCSQPRKRELRVLSWLCGSNRD